MFSVFLRFIKASWQTIILIVIVGFCTVSLIGAVKSPVNQHFSLLATSFLQGKVYLLQDVGNDWLDTVFYKGEHYWPLGPFPALILMPFVALFTLFKLFFYQGYLNFILGIEIFFLIWSMARKQGFNNSESVLWAIGFCFGSVLFGVLSVPWSYFFAHTVAVFLCCMLLFEFYYGKRSWLRLGLIAGCLLMTRIPSGIGVFAWFAFISFGFHFSSKKIFVIRNYGWVVGLILSVSLLAGYNYVRFNNAFDSGYNNQILYTPAHIQARQYGMFSLKHVPGNIYASILSGPLPVYKDQFSHVLKFPFIYPNPWGMSIFVTSPYLLYLIFYRHRNKNIQLLIPTLIGLVFIYSYYGIGYFQYGYRYFLDVFPFLFLMVMKQVWEKDRKLSRIMTLLIICSVGINYYLLIVAPNYFP